MKTLKIRIKDSNKKDLLCELAKEVNFVWNYCNELGLKYLQQTGKFLSAYDIDRYTQGASKECRLHSQTIQSISKQYVTRRKQFKKKKLAWRVSSQNSSRRSLGWIPFKKSAVKYGDGFIKYGDYLFKLWDSYGLSNFNIIDGSFVEDARGRWYVCVTIKTPNASKRQAKKAVGIDLGLKNIATCSDGTTISNPRYFNYYQNKLGKAQRAKKKRLTKNIHARIKNSRKDYLQKQSSKLVKDNWLVVVGNLSANKLTKTKMAKSVNDTGFSAFKTMLKYKCENAGAWFIEVSEKYTTQTCSYCGEISPNSPKGRAGLRIREWICGICNTTHDRDINAAKNILRLGHQTLAGGIPS